jgi:hypothetical protein
VNVHAVSIETFPGYPHAKHLVAVSVERLRELEGGAHGTLGHLAAIHPSKGEFGDTRASLDGMVRRERKRRILEGLHRSDVHSKRFSLLGLPRVINNQQFFAVANGIYLVVRNLVDKGTSLSDIEATLRMAE